MSSELILEKTTKLPSQNWRFRQTNWEWRLGQGHQDSLVNFLVGNGLVKLKIKAIRSSNRDLVRPVHASRIGKCSKTASLFQFCQLTPFSFRLASECVFWVSDWVGEALSDLSDISNTILQIGSGLMVTNPAYTFSDGGYFRIVDFVFIFIELLQSIQAALTTPRFQMTTGYQRVNFDE